MPCMTPKMLAAERRIGCDLAEFIVREINEGARLKGIQKDLRVTKPTLLNWMLKLGITVKRRASIG